MHPPVQILWLFRNVHNPTARDRARANIWPLKESSLNSKCTAINKAQVECKIIIARSFSSPIKKQLHLKDQVWFTPSPSCKHRFSLEHWIHRLTLNCYWYLIRQERTYPTILKMELVIEFLNANSPRIENVFSFAYGPHRSHFVHHKNFQSCRLPKPPHQVPFFPPSSFFGRGLATLQEDLSIRQSVISLVCKHELKS